MTALLCFIKVRENFNYRSIKMKYFGHGLSEQHKELNSIIRKSSETQRSKDLFLQIHAKLHPSVVSDTDRNEVDNLLCDLKQNEYAVMPASKDETIAWVLWHIARIEDLTMNILVAREEQVFNQDWRERLNSRITDTGNALTDDEIMELSRTINTEQLICYRNAVAHKTRDIIRSLSAADLKRRVRQGDIDKILSVGGVTQQENSIWLLDFWGKKDVAGILLMPPARHVMLHLNDCCKWKEYIRTKKTFFRS